MPPRAIRPKDVYEQSFTVGFEYPVAFVEGALRPDEPALAWAIARREPERRHPLFFVLDGGLVGARPSLADDAQAYVERHAELELRAPPSVVPGGEAAKNDPGVVGALHAELVRARLDRQAAVVVIGGGAVLDAAGYAAATLHRGVRVVRLPSTVLSQCDGGVGVKNGVNAFSTKNLIGTFAPPYAVVNDLALLDTLPLRDARAGMAEAVKVALIRDAGLFDWLEANAGALARAERGLVGALVRRAAELHLSHIARAGDPFELGSARPLDYGHWAAHKLETLTRHALRHGEAVAIGIALDSRYSVEAGLLDEGSLTRICAVLETLGLPTWDDALSRRDATGGLLVLRGLEEFREHLGGELSLTMLRGLGHGVEVHQVEEAALLRALDWLRARSGRA